MFDSSFEELRRKVPISQLQEVDLNYYLTGSRSLPGGRADKGVPLVAGGGGAGGRGGSWRGDL